ncbi:Endospore coat-associated protein YheD [compost metagenome]
MNDFAYKLADYLEVKFGKLCELGMDIAVDPKGNVWLLEVNPKPSREVFNRIGQHATYQKAVTRPLEYALWMLKQKNQSLD